MPIDFFNLIAGLLFFGGTAIIAVLLIKFYRKREYKKVKILSNKDVESIRLLGFIFLMAGFGISIGTPIIDGESLPLKVFSFLLGALLLYLANRKQSKAILPDGPDYTVDPKGVAKHTGKPRTDYGFLKK